MSRLQAGALALAVQPIDVADVISAAVSSLGPAAYEVIIPGPRRHPGGFGRPRFAGTSNRQSRAKCHTPQPGQHPAAGHGQCPRRCCRDPGHRLRPGIPEGDWDQIFQPFQRLGDRDNTSGVGLGLALSRGLIEAMSGTLSPEGTPGGGLTMTISLPAVTRPIPEPVQTAGERP